MIRLVDGRTLDSGSIRSIAGHADEPLSVDELWDPDIGKWGDAMGAGVMKVTQAADYAPALRNALALRTPVVIDVDVVLDVQGYRSIWYPYPRDFYRTWKPGPATA